MNIKLFNVMSNKNIERAISFRSNQAKRRKLERRAGKRK
jgi:hypothetical protein